MRGANKKHHYCYRIDFDDGYYLGCRSCDCDPEDDTGYKGSGVACLMRRQRTFTKTILSRHKTKLHAFIAEALLLRTHYGNPTLLNMSRGHAMSIPDFGGDEHSDWQI